MYKGAPLRWLENRYLRQFLRGQGVEIGALFKKFPVSAGAGVWYVDRHCVPELQKYYGLKPGNSVQPDVLADASHLPFAAGSVDFIIASHVLEHLQFPLAGLKWWYEALKPGGVLVLRVPDKRFTFDSPRPRTTLAHLIEEHENPACFNKERHFEDYLKHVHAGKEGDAAYQRDLRHASDDDVHYHVWIDEDVREIVEYTRKTWGLAWHPVVSWDAHFYRKEAVMLLRRTGVNGRV